MRTRSTKGRRMGRDEERDFGQEVEELVGDPEATMADVLGLIVDHCDEDQLPKLLGAVREIANAMDSGGSASKWAGDRRQARDVRKRAAADRKRLGRDDPPPFPGRPQTGGGMDPMEGEDKRRRMAGDMAFDRSPRGSFSRRFPNLAAVERA